jgi:hypothetical protein
MAATHIGLTTIGTNDASGTTIPCTRTASAGNALIVEVAWANNVTCTVSDNAGNTYASARKHSIGTTDHLEVFHALNITGGSPITITATFSAGATYRRIQGHEVSGLMTSGALDQVNSANGSSATLASGTITTTQNDEYLFAAFSAFDQGTYTPGGGWIAGGSPGGDGFNEYRIPTATGTFNGNASMTVSTAWLAVVASFKAAAGGIAIPVLTRQYRERSA